jgi:hypothetical protein
MRINSYLIRGIGDMFTPQTITFAIGTALPIALLWLGIGWLLWDFVVDLTTTIVSWVPFSILQANGLFFIIFYLWFAAVLISYALFIGLAGGFLASKGSEARFEAINFGAIFFFAVTWAIILFVFWPSLAERIQHYLSTMPFKTVAEWISRLLALYILYNLFLLTEYIVAFLLRNSFLSRLTKQPAAPTSRPKATLHLFANILFYLLLSVVALPLLFLPVANFLTVWFLWAWLYKESAFFGVCTTVCEEQRCKSIAQKRIGVFVIAFLGALLNFIPVVSFFTPFFIFSLYYHWTQEECSVA